MLRAILDAELLSDALGALQAGNRSSSANYLLAHRDGMAVDVEAAPGDFSRLYLHFPEAGRLLHTNHFLTERLPVRDVSLWAMSDSPFRLDRLRGATAAAGPSLSLEDMRAALADHANYPSGVCCHPDARLPRLEQGATVASVVMDLDERILWVADGHPCTAEYRRLDYAAFLAKPSPLRPGGTAAAAVGVSGAA